MRVQRTTYLVLLISAIAYILYISQSYLIPLVIALMIWDIVRGLRDFFSKIKFIKKYCPIWLLNTMSFGLIFLVLAFISNLIINGITSFSNDLPQYEANIFKINDSINNSYSFNPLSQLESFTGSFDFTKMIEPILNSLTTILADGFMITLYCIFILLEESTFRKKINVLFKNEKQAEKVRYILHEIDELFTQYLSLKTMVSLLTGFLSYIALLILGVNSPILWAILIFLLNYIPSIGSLIATAFPAIVAMLQFGDVMSGVWVLVSVGIVQVVVGNFIEPRMMGNSLNISPLVVLLALVIWGAIWGIIGMLLSVPITVMIMIILAQFENTKGVAVMLSADGDISKL